jgi:uncharacterized protein (TIGR02270 family)
MTAPSAPVVWDVLEEHLDEAAFLWSQWERALASPVTTIARVAAGPEERLLAHLDGLALGGPVAAEQLLVPALGDDDPGKAFAAAAALAASGGLEAIRDVAPAEPGPGRVVSRALALTLPVGGERVLEGWLTDAGEPARAIALEALAFRGAVPAGALPRLLEGAAPRLMAAALRAAGDGGDGYRSAVEAFLRAEEVGVRDAALLAALRLGLRSALLASRRAVESGGAAPTLPLELLALCGDPDDLDRIGAAMGSAAQRRAAIWAAGLSGWPGAGDLCLPHLYDPELQRLAFEALSAIAGPAIARITGPEPGEGPDGAADPRDLLPAPEGELPMPDPELVESAWQRLRPGLAPGQRFLGGVPLAPEVLFRAFASGPTRRRHALGLELALRSRGEVRVETRAWAREQLRAQAAARVVGRADFGQPLSRILKA